MPENFTPYKDRPALDKGPRISWTDLESGMLFQPGAGLPTLRRVRGVPNFIWHGDFHSPSYMIGTEDAADGRPCGGVIGCGDEFYIRGYLDDGRPFYTTASAGSFATDAETIERLRIEFTAKLAEVQALVAADPENLALSRRLRIADENLAKIDEVSS
jgi:hypothetical protein